MNKSTYPKIIILLDVDEEPEWIPRWPKVGERVEHRMRLRLRGTVEERGLRMGSGGRETNVALVKWDSGSRYWLSLWRLDQERWADEALA